MATSCRSSEKEPKIIQRQLPMMMIKMIKIMILMAIIHWYFLQTIMVLLMMSMMMMVAIQIEVDDDDVDGRELAIGTSCQDNHKRSNDSCQLYLEATTVGNDSCQFAERGNRKFELRPRHSWKIVESSIQGNLFQVKSRNIYLLCHSRYHLRSLGTNFLTKIFNFGVKTVEGYLLLSLGSKLALKICLS